MQAAVARRRALDAKLVRDSAVHAAADAPAQALEQVDQVNLDTPLEPHPDLVRGQLENGLEYVILPNKSPPGRFEAHLQACPSGYFPDKHVLYTYPDEGMFVLPLLLAVIFDSGRPGDSWCFCTYFRTPAALPPTCCDKIPIACSALSLHCAICIAGSRLCVGEQHGLHLEAGTVSAAMRKVEGRTAPRHAERSPLAPLTC